MKEMVEFTLTVQHSEDKLEQSVGDNLQQH